MKDRAHSSGLDLPVALRVSDAKTVNPDEGYSELFAYPDSFYERFDKLGRRCAHLSLSQGFIGRFGRLISTPTVAERGVS